MAKLAMACASCPNCCTADEEPACSEPCSLQNHWTKRETCSFHRVHIAAFTAVQAGQSWAKKEPRYTEVMDGDISCFVETPTRQSRDGSAPQKCRSPQRLDSQLGGTVWTAKASSKTGNFFGRANFRALHAKYPTVSRLTFIQ